MELPLATLYSSLPTAALHLLRDAFQFDMAHGADPAFCQTRLDLIEQLLRERRDAAATRVLNELGSD